MKMKRFFSLAALCISLSAFAQTGIIKGQVKDTTRMEALPGAVIYAAEGYGLVTDLDGHYDMQLPAGSYTIEYRFVGYITQSRSITIHDGETLQVDVNLKQDEGILNTVVITGSKFEKKIGEETVSIDVIKPNLIDNANDVSIDDAIDKIPGINVIDGQANIRGGSGFSYGAGSRVLLLMDDLPILTGDAAFPSWDFIPVENIEQVEIIKGAASALYGSSALNGIINVRTAYPTSTPQTKISFFNGAYFHPQDIAQKWWGDDFPFFNGLSVAHRQKFGKFDLVAGTYIYNENSYLMGDYDRRARVNINTRYRINTNLAVGININSQVSRSSSFIFWSDVDTGLYIPAPNTLSINRGFKLTIDPFLNYYDKKGNRHKLVLRYFQSHNDSQTDQGTLGDMFYGEYQYQKHFDNIHTVITSGLVGQYATVDATLYGDSVYHTSNEAIYLQLDKKFFGKLNTGMGVRYEMNQIAGQQEARPVFRFGANYQLADYTYVRASWGQGYRFPTIAEKYIRTNISLLGIFPNPDLTSETGWSAELGIKQGIKISNWKGYVDISGFMSEYFNMMEFTFGYYPESGATIPYGFKSLNIGDTKITGAEISIVGEGNLGNIPTTLIAGYTYINPIFQDWDSLQNALSSADYNVLKYRFRHVVKVEAESNFNRLRAGISFSYLSYMEAVDAAFVDPIFPGTSAYIIQGLQEYRDEHNKGDYILDAHIAFALNDNADLSLICNNVLNRAYSIRPAIMEAPRNVTIKYSTKL